MKAYRFLYVLVAIPLPSCLIYDESLFGDEDANPAVGGSPQTDDAGSGGDGPGSGGTSVGVGGTTGSGGDGPAAGGAASAGGSPGSGGGTSLCDGGIGTTGPFTGVGATKLLENFDTNTKFIQDGDDDDLTGSWYVGVDPSPAGAGITPSNASWVYQQDPCLTAGNKSMHVTGTGYTAWGASFDAALKASNADFDATGYKGIVYWARVANEGQQIKIAFQDADAGSVETNPKTLTTVWEQYKADFPSGIDPARLRMVQLVSVGQAAFDFWVDDVTFYKVP